MDDAVCRGWMSLAAGLLLAGATSVIWPAAGAAAPEFEASPEAHPEAQQTLGGFRQSVWLLYASSAAIGEDARGRTIAQDLAAWVLPDEIRRQLGTANTEGIGADHGPPDGVLPESQRRLALIELYWSRQYTLRRQRALWRQVLQEAPASEAQVSRARIDPLESKLQHDFAPTMTLEALSGEVHELALAYDHR